MRHFVFLIIFFFVSFDSLSKELTKPVINLDDAIMKLESGNDLEALLDFQILATEGNIVAQTYLGQMYRTGRGLSQNFTKAAMWLGKAAKAGNASANHRLGWMYSRGQIDGKRDDKMAVKYWKKAAELGDPYAQSDLGVMYSRGDVVDKDMVLAYYWLVKSSNQTGQKSMNLSKVQNEMTPDEFDKALRLLEKK
ncbi:MAG: tetratricopeptide repeat protein [Pseudomonadota bacterium]|nr:tetratricopeptide repeat protein [Pseudomonadota bacterium]